MKENTITVTNDTGLHSRPADLFVRTAKLYKSNIIVQKGDKTANAKSIIKLILLNIIENDSIKIIADGPDEEEALSALQRLIESDFTDVKAEVVV